MVRAVFKTAVEVHTIPTRPPVSSPRVAAKRLEALCMDELYRPLRSTEANRSRRFSRGTLTWVKRMAPLSMPLRPTLYPQSLISTPGSWLPASSRSGTMMACTPWSSRPPLPSILGTFSRAKTEANLPSHAAFPIHHFMAPSSGVCTIHSSVATSRIASVCRPATLLPWYSSVIAKHPGALKVSMSWKNFWRWRSDPRFITLPPHRVNCTPVLMVSERSTWARASAMQ
mmetsp:Transcript_816/g.2466  ORF Transcript_816/g.2466 Transcript_816/m.2466 type:complete len:228 (-) Transcript_816:653-1336(-)